MSEPTQERLFDPTRYSPVSVAIWQRLPESNARAFGIASALGSFRDSSGSSDRLRSGRQAAGTLVTSRRLPAILDAIGISSRQWRRYVADWTARYLAHRCDKGVVFLFAVPVWEDCPACRQWFPMDPAPPSWRVDKEPRGFARADVLRPHERPRYGHSSGLGTAAGPAPERPRFERKSAPPNDGFLQGVEVRGLLQPEEEALEEEALEPKTRRPRENAPAEETP